LISPELIQRPGNFPTVGLDIAAGQIHQEGLRIMIFKLRRGLAADAARG